LCQRDVHRWTKVLRKSRMATPAELRAVKNLKHVNAIAANQRLTLVAVGLTVIRGDNGVD